MEQNRIEGNIADRLKGTKTEQNLHTALSGESQAYLRYKWFEQKAREEDRVEISQIFCETAENEKEHAEIWFRYLGDRSTTEENLKTAVGGEHFEWETMYAEFEKTARDEGFVDIAELFKKVAEIEKYHEERYSTYLADLNAGNLQKSAASVKWICINCGYIYEGMEPPKVCPVCKHPAGYYKKMK